MTRDSTPADVLLAFFAGVFVVGTQMTPSWMKVTR